MVSADTNNHCHRNLQRGPLWSVNSGREGPHIDRVTWLISGHRQIGVESQSAEDTVGSGLNLQWISAFHILKRTNGIPGGWGPLLTCGPFSPGLSHRQTPPSQPQPQQQAHCPTFHEAQCLTFFQVSWIICVINLQAD